MDTVFQDLRFAVRGLLKTPAFTATAVVTLALGIGANAAMFGIVDTLLLRTPDGVRDPGALVRVYYANQWRVLGRVVQPSGSYPLFAAVREGARTLSGAAAEWPRDLWIGQGEGARQARVALVSAGYAPLLGVGIQRGRWFGPADEVAGGPPVAVISDRLWRTAYQAGGGVLGQSVVVRGKPYTIIGVAPPRFGGTGLEPVELWLPMAVAANELVFPDALTNAGNRWLLIIGRLAPGATPEQAAAELSGIYRAVDNAGDSDPDTTAHVILGPIQGSRRPTNGTSLALLPLLLWGMALVVLAISAANVANLLLARAAARRREIAVRLALGASGGRLLRQLMTESVLLAALGSAAALLVASWAAPLMRGLILPAAVAGRAPVDWRVLACTALVALIVGIATGVVPGLRAGRADLLGDLKSGGRGDTQRSRLRSGLLLTQAALTLVLLAGAGLFVRSFSNVLRIDLGLDPRRLVEVDVDLSALPKDTALARATFDRVLERLRATPGVASAAMSVSGPFGWSFSTRIRVAGLDSVPTLPSGGPYYNAVTPDFFATMGTTVLRGRAFTADDGMGAPPVAVVGATMARLFWPDGSALGQCIIRLDQGACIRVVGVAEDAHRNTVIERPQLQWYVPLAQLVGGPDHRALWVRTAGEPESLLPLLRRTTQAVLPAGASYVTAEPVQDAVTGQLRPWRLGATAFTAFAGLALVLAAVGLYGVLAFRVASQTREIGVRIALGARAGAVVGGVVRSGLAMVGPGLLIGAAAALAGGRVVRSLLYGIEPFNPLVLGIEAAVLLATALLACAVPAWRAASVDPLVALRAE